MQLSQGSEVERYVVEAMLGQGGMATVYRVRHAQLGTRHALKILSLPSASIRERLLQEGRVQATLHHPNIVAVTDVIDVSGAPGLLMEYVAGPSLDQLLVRRKLSRDEADDVVAGILAGVAAAHRAGLVHRDLKPANILLSTVRGRVVAKVADFGLAKILAEDGGATQTRTGATMGTPAYMAPEQIRNARGVDLRADIFALGAILYELAIGKRAFEGEDTLDLFNAISRAEFIDPREVDPSTPDRMVDAINAALNVEKGARPANCEALWALWSGEETDLEAIANSSGTSWSTEGLEELEGLSGHETPLPDGSFAETGEWLAVDVPGGEKAQSTYDAPTARVTGTIAPSSPSSIESSEATSTARGAVLGVVATLLLLSGAFGAYQWSLSGPPIAAHLPAPAPVVRPAPEPIPEVPTPVPAPELEAVAAPTSIAVPKTAAAVAESEPLSTTSPELANGVAVVTGDAESVALVGPDGRVLLTAIPPGEYRVLATFNGTERGIGEVQIAPGQTVSVSCNSALKHCIIE